MLIEGTALERRTVRGFAKELGVKPHAALILLALHRDGPQSLPGLRTLLAFGESTVSEGLTALAGLRLVRDRYQQSPSTGRAVRIASATAIGNRKAEAFLDQTAIEELARKRRRRRRAAA